MPTERILGIDIEFPYEPYECQKAFMTKVLESLDSRTHAVLESPTGTGKTLSLLCSTLAWLEKEKMKLLPSIPGQSNGIMNGLKLPKVIYATRTHSQLKQVVREINKTRYKYMKVAILASRDQFCIHEKVMKEENSHLKSLMCRNLVKCRKCHYYNNFEKDKELANELYKNFSNGEQTVLDIEEMVDISKKLRHCPFYRSRQMHEEADLILLPYNYILDPKVREAHRINLLENILIFDEAHNLVSMVQRSRIKIKESICEQSVSGELSTKELALCQREATKVLELVIAEEERAREEAENSILTFDQLEKQKENKKEDDKLNKQDVAVLLSKLQELEKGIDSIDLKNGGKSFQNLPGRIFDGIHMIKLLETSGIKRDMRDPISLIIDRIGVFLAQTASNSSGLWAVTGAHLSNFASFISKVFVDTFEGVSEFDRPNAILKIHDKNIAANNFQLYITKENEGIKLFYWCFSAGLAMRYLRSRGTRSIILTSGTLSPLDHFVHTMGMLENVHVAHKDQVVVGALRNGFDTRPINGKFENRGQEAYKMRVGHVLLSVIQATPQGVLAFFPSYTQLYDCVKCWQSFNKDGNSLWNEMEKSKKLFIEPKNKNEVPILELELSQAIASDRGALLLAVCRGKLSEGIDFKDSHCRAVFIVSIPFPPFHDPRVILKKHFLNEQKKSTNKKGITGDDWYNIEGVRAVNQAIGRVIRHKDDFGVVILADERYIRLPISSLPSWIRPNLTTYDSPQSVITRISTFFKERGVLVKQSQKRLQEVRIDLPTRKRPASLAIENEQNMPKKDINDLEKLYMNENNSIESDTNIGFKKPNIIDSHQTKKSTLKLKPNSSISSYVGHERIKNISSPLSVNEKELPCSSKDLSDGKFENLTIKQSQKIIKPVLNLNQPKTNSGFKQNTLIKLPTYTAVEYKNLIDPLPQLIRKNIRKAHIEYLDSQNIEEFIKRFSQITLPQYPHIFLGFYSFLNECHQSRFKSYCVQQRLV